VIREGDIVGEHDVKREMVAVVDVMTKNTWWTWWM